MKVKRVLIWSGIIFIAIVAIVLLKNNKIQRNSAVITINTNNNSKIVSKDYDFSLKHDGLTRKYLVHLPTNYNNKIPVPLVLAFHGGGGNAKDSPKYFKLNDKADKEGFIVVYPEGTGKKSLGKFFGTWNAGGCCVDAIKNNIDDVGFVKKMIEQLEKNFNVDQKRIYATGFSNGAQMSYRLACELSDKIAAIAPGGSMGTFKKCNLTRPVSVFAFDGTSDPCMPYNGGDKCGVCFSNFLNNIGVPAKYEPYHCEAIKEHIEKWKKLDGCTDEQKIIYQKKNTTCISYQNCREKAEVVLCTIKGGGHVWPGNKEYSVNFCKNNPQGKICNEWKKAVGALTPDFNVNDMIWNFFKKHPMVDNN